MSLINTMLAGLEERQAYLSEGRNAVFEGLAPVNDDNFHKRERRYNRWLGALSLLALAGLVITYLYRNPTDTIAPQVANAALVKPVAPATNPVHVATHVAMPSKQMQVNAAEQNTPAPESKRIALKMDYSLPKDGATQPAVAEVTAEVTKKAIDQPAVVSAGEPALLAYDVVSVEGVTMIKLELSDRADYRIYELNKPDRVVVEFDTFLSLPKEFPRRIGQGQVDQIRGHHSGNRKRTVVVFDLSAPVVVEHSTIKETGDRFELDVRITPILGIVEVPAATTPVASKPAAPAVEEVYKPREGTLSVTRNNDTPDQMLSRGLNSYNNGRIEEGLGQITKAVQSDPGNIQIRTSLVNLYVAQNRLPKAILVLDEGIRLLPEHYDWRVLKAKLLVKLNKLDEAIATLINSGPDVNSDPEYHAFLAALLQQQGRNEEAVRYYRNAVSVRGDNGVWWMGLGISLEKIGQSEDAANAYKNAINDNTLSPDIRNYVKNRLANISG
jgi:tetratricopeptide (TPR) repeat protein